MLEVMTGLIKQNGRMLKSLVNKQQLPPVPEQLGNGNFQTAIADRSRREKAEDHTDFQITTTCFGKL